MTRTDEMLQFLKALSRALARYVAEADREAFYAAIRRASGAEAAQKPGLKETK